MWLDLLREILIFILHIVRWIPGVEKRWQIRQRMMGPWSSPGVLWMHGASMGECGVLLQVARDLKEIPILITTQKVEVKHWLTQRCSLNVQVALAPLDHAGVMKRFLDSVRPGVLVLCENELWPNWVCSCALRGIPVTMVSGILSERAARHWLRFAGQDLCLALKHIHPLWVQNENAAKRFQAFGKKDVLVGGDWKWLSMPIEPAHMQMDTVAEWEARPVDLALVSIRREDWPCLRAGLVTYAEFGGCTVLIPRWPQDLRFFAASLLRAGIRVRIWPRLERGCVSIVDTYGQVPQVLECSRLALMGGSFCKAGVHNYREPLFLGVPVLVGPNGGNQEEELRALESAGVLYRLGNLEELCLGRKGRDAWISTWFPWEKRFQIPQAIAERKTLVDASFREFRQWLYQLRIFGE